MNEIQVRPNYLLIGAAKCATTSICAHLEKHPDIFMYELKEAHFFSVDQHFSRGFPWYETLFAKAGSRKMVGEGSTTYTMKELFPNTVARMAAYERDLKLFYVVRDPFARIESFWTECRSWTHEVHHDFSRAVRINRDVLVDSSNYLRQIDEYRRYYADDQIQILFYEDFRADPAGFMRRCFEFLDVDPEAALANVEIHLHPSNGRRVLRPLFSRFRSWAGYRIARRLIPSRVKTAVFRSPVFRPLVSAKTLGRPQWNADARRLVLDVLRDDLLHFLQRYGKPREFWKSLESP